MYIQGNKAPNALRSIVRSKCVANGTRQCAPAFRHIDMRRMDQKEHFKFFSIAREIEKQHGLCTGSVVRPSALRQAGKAASRPSGTIEPAARVPSATAGESMRKSSPEKIALSDNESTTQRNTARLADTLAPETNKASCAENTADSPPTREKAPKAPMAQSEPAIPALDHKMAETKPPPRQAPNASAPDSKRPSAEHASTPAESRTETHATQETVYPPTQPDHEGLLSYQKWWFLNDVDVRVDGELLSGTPISLHGDTLRMINDAYSYFIPMNKIAYIRTPDGMSTLDALWKRKPVSG